MIKSNLSDDLITITQKLMMARERSEVIKIASDCNALIEKLIALENHGNTKLKKQASSFTTIIKFTNKEIQMMSFTFKKEFIANVEIDSIYSNYGKIYISEEIILFILESV